MLRRFARVDTYRMHGTGVRLRGSLAYRRTGRAFEHCRVWWQRGNQKVIRTLELVAPVLGRSL